MALSNLYGWNKKSTASSACGTACGASDKPEQKPTACGTGDKPAACGTGCGAGDNQ